MHYKINISFNEEPNRFLGGKVAQGHVRVISPHLYLKQNRMNLPGDNTEPNVSTLICIYAIRKFMSNKVDVAEHSQSHLTYVSRLRTDWATLIFIY